MLLLVRILLYRGLLHATSAFYFKDWLPCKVTARAIVMSGYVFLNACLLYVFRFVYLFSK